MWDMITSDRRKFAQKNEVEVDVSVFWQCYTRLARKSKVKFTVDQDTSGSIDKTFLFSLHNFTQLIDIPTRTATLTINEIKHTTVSLIELIFTNNEDNITKHGTTDPIADHDGIFVSFHC